VQNLKLYLDSQETLLYPFESIYLSDQLGEEGRVINSH